MSTEFGIHVRRRHKAALETLSRAAANAVQQGDFFDAGASRDSTGLANSLRKLCCACRDFLADDTMKEHLPENKSTEAGPGTRFLIGAKRTGTQTMSRARAPLFKSKAEAEADFQAMCRANEARMNGRPAELPAASGGNRLAAAMTRDLKPAQPASAKPGLAVLHRAMGVRS
jgi:hypothetical protein